jgi:hypothetical protein
MRPRRRTPGGAYGTIIGQDVENENGTTHNIRQIHDRPRMARIENSSQPTSSRKGFDEHIMAARQSPLFSTP